MGSGGHSGSHHFKDALTQTLGEWLGSQVTMDGEVDHLRLQALLDKVALQTALDQQQRMLQLDSALQQLALPAPTVSCQTGVSLRLLH